MNAAGIANSKGRLTQVANTYSTTYYTGFDSMGRVTNSIQQLAGYNYPFTYTYNLTGSLTSESYPSGRVVSTSYNGADRANAVSGILNATQTNYISNVKYAPQGAPALYSYGNNLWRTYNYNSRLQVSSLWDAFANVPSSFTFIENPLNWGATTNNGNLLGVSLYAGGPGPSGSLKHFNQAFAYDGMNRLQTASDDGGWTRNFGYDAFGNMWATGTGIATTTTPGSNVYNGNNQNGAVPYDAAGNQSVVNGNALIYDAENRLAQETDGVSHATETYSYDGDGRRVFRASSTGVLNVYVYDAMGTLAAEYSNTAQSSPCVTCYVSVDHLGSTRAVTDANGKLVSLHDYLPFGEEIQANQTGRTNLWGPGNDSIAQRFTGKERDRESGLDYFGARYYSSALGRWTSPDEPFADQHPEDPQSWNMYGYVRNNPLRSIDPDGKDAWDIVNGAFNAIRSDNAFGAGRQTGNSDFQLGQKIGDGVAFVQGGLQIIAGVGGDAGGGLVTATGIGVPAGVPVMAVSTAVGMDGVGVAGTAADNLIVAASSTSTNRGEAPLVGSNPRDAKGRTNTDLPGGHAEAKKTFDVLTQSQDVKTDPNTGHQVSPDGTRLRLNSDGTARVDIPASDSRPKRETVHFNNPDKKLDQP